jgi:hypothetical protein
MNRTLKISGAEVPAFDIPIKLKIVTKCPNKWKLIDMETGEEYIGQVPTDEDTHHWKKIE